MAAPAPSQRVAPTNSVRLENGYRSLVTFSLDTNLDVFEKAVTPAGYDGGEPINTADMFRNFWQTQAPRALVKMTPLTMVCNYDPKVYSQLKAMYNKRQTITEWYPNGDNLAYFGYIQKVDRNSHADGTQPEMTITVIPTNEDPTTHEEEDPVFTEYTGTGDPYAYLL